VYAISYILSKLQFSLLPPVVMDEGNFGKAIKQPAASYRRGDMVEVVFESANPRNNLRIGDTFLTVEIQERFVRLLPVAL